MDIIQAALKDPVLGQDFLTWLWYKSEKNGWLFKLPGGEEFNVYLEQKISVRGGDGENVETATVSGPHAQFGEARIGIRNGKRVDRALLRIEQDGNTWMADVKALDFALTLRTPKIETKNEEGDDPDAVFLEKMYLIERGYAFFDALYAMFVKLRLTPAWNVELKDFETWLNES